MTKEILIETIEREKEFSKALYEKCDIILRQIDAIRKMEDMIKTKDKEIEEFKSNGTKKPAPSRTS